MATLNELIRNRRAALGQLRQSLKPVDTSLEKLERDLKQLQARKNKVPETADLLAITGFANEMDRNLSTFAGKLREVARLFGTI